MSAKVVVLKSFIPKDTVIVCPTCRTYLHRFVKNAPKGKKIRSEDVEPSPDPTGVMVCEKCNTPFAKRRDSDGHILLHTDKGWIVATYFGDENVGKAV